MLGEAWPRIMATISMGTPAASSREPAPWRMSCRQSRGGAADTARSSNSFAAVSGRCGVPSCRADVPPSSGSD
jgi:hypothetical protein